jgi:hypothetical protein
LESSHTTFDALVEAMKTFANDRDFFLARKTNSMDEKRSLELFSTKKAIQRGWFYCTKSEKGTQQTAPSK